MKPEPTSTLVRNAAPHDIRVRLNEHGIWLDAIMGTERDEVLTLSIPLTGDEANRLAELLQNAAEDQTEAYLMGDPPVYASQEEFDADHWDYDPLFQSPDDDGGE